MHGLKRLAAQRLAAKTATKGRTSIVRVLLLLGCSLVSTILLVLSFSPLLRFPQWILLVSSGGLFAGFIALGMKYRRNRSAERDANRISPRSMIASMIIMFSLLGLVVFGLSVFISASLEHDFTSTPESLEALLVAVVILTVVAYFSATPFIMAAWYRTSPRAAVRFVLKLHALFHRKTSKNVTRVLVTRVPQGHSTIVTVKRAFTWLIFSASFTFIAWIPLFERGTLPLLPAISTVNSVEFVLFSIGHLLHLVAPVIISFFLFAWIVPPCYLLDDAGVVFFRAFLKRRQPAEIRSISSWFLGMVKAVLGTGALITYAQFVISRLPVIGVVAAELGTLPAVQYGIFILGFPFTGTVLMAFALLAFQETQFNKLKTFLYQELAKAGIDPRIVEVSLQATGEFQDKTLLDYHGENFFHAPPLRDLATRLDDGGEGA